MTTMDQPRVPAGHPSGNGGEFTSKPASEADVVLDQLYREDEGTFHYPPVCRSYESLLSFWSNVQVPEESLVRFENGYLRVRRARINEALARWDQANPAPNHSNRRAQWEADRQQVLKQLEKREPVMWPPLVRPLVRLNRMYNYHSTLPAEERQKFLTRKFRLPTGDEGTVEELLTKYRTSEYQSDLITSSVDEHNELLEQLRRTSVNIQHELRNIRHGV